MTYETEMRVNKLRRACQLQMDIIQAFEELRGNPEVTEEELNAAIEEENAKLTAYENEITSIIWK